MADYYPLLARAIDQQSTKGREARAAIYARARKALLAQLSGVNPPMQAEDIARQQDFLEVAIRRVEADYGAHDPEPAAAPQAAPVVPSRPTPPPEPATPGPAVAAPKPVAPKPAAPKPEAPKAEAPKAEAPKPAAPKSEAAQPAVSKSFIPMPEQPTAAPAPVDTPAAELSGRAPRPRALDGEGDAEDELWQRTERPALLDEDTDLDAADPQAGAARGRRKGLIIGAVAVLVLLAVAGGLYSQRARLTGSTQSASSSATPAQQTAQAPAGTPAPEATAKSTDRVAQAPSAATAQQPVAPPPAVQAAPRAMLLEESAGSGQGVQQFVGKVTWSTENFQPGTGQAQDIGIRALIDIPDRNFKATMTIRRNPDPNIPASHIVEVQFQLPPDFDYGNVSSVPGIQAMASEGAQGAPLRGLAVRVAPGYFLVGLLSGDREQQYNMSMLFSRGFLNVPVVFENGRRAILVVEKGAAGEEAFRTAFTAWGLLRPQQPAQPNGN
ncbi:hypothetical protein LGR54_20575 [Ancylobacter sp. Lp-2]|uniref:hypothetical protein n=1 Tax=Ancylobacter sp. Lp-2 TaxID=2881339 RepID=UPI001E4021A6|nr:hypothetical protein [Ancylobacter sp. Lp-2]MCB4771008.1 hypothetical protein [Ancylobacter sp. Lp-2]